MEMLELRLHLLYPGSFFPEEKVLIVDSVAQGIKKAKEMFKKDTPRPSRGFFICAYKAKVLAIA